MFRFFRKKASEDTRAASPQAVSSPLNAALQESDYPAAIAILEETTRADPNLNTLFLTVELKALVEDFDGALAGSGPDAADRPGTGDLR